MFTLSKIFWIVAQPGNLLVFFLIVGAALLWTRRRRTGRWMVALAGLGLALPKFNSARIGSIKVLRSPLR